MKFTFSFLFLTLLMTSCVSKKKYIDLGYELDSAVNKLSATEFDLNECNTEKSRLQAKLASEKDRYDILVTTNATLEKSYKEQIQELKQRSEQQYSQVGELTVLSKTASDNMGQTIRQLEKKDQYIRYLMNAKDKADSLNLALAINLKSVLRKGIEDQDIEVKVDKTVVYVNLSDKMLFDSGRYTLTARADEVLSKVAQIAKSRSDLDLMVEGYTDNVPIKNSCVADNWDLSVKRSAEVVRTLQTKYGINPDKLIAAGRGEYNRLAENTTEEGKATNRRTRIILLPKLGQFYDLLKPQQ